MSVETAKAKILKALEGIDIDSLDDAKSIRSEGNLLAFEGMGKKGFAIREYIFALYVSKKILDRKTDRIYPLLDLINTKIEDEARLGPYGDEIALQSIRAIGFENGIIEYRCEIHVIEK